MPNLLLWGKLLMYLILVSALISLVIIEVTDLIKFLKNPEYETINEKVERLIRDSIHRMRGNTKED